MVNGELPNIPFNFCIADRFASATHFRTLLQSFPPQTSSRDAASQWGCHVHNQVNERLEKPVFDCMTIADKYKCGCAETDDEEGLKGSKVGKKKDGKKKEDELDLEREG